MGPGDSVTLEQFWESQLLRNSRQQSDSEIRFLVTILKAQILNARSSNGTPTPTLKYSKASREGISAHETCSPGTMKLGTKGANMMAIATLSAPAQIVLLDDQTDAYMIEVEFRTNPKRQRSGWMWCEEQRGDKTLAAVSCQRRRLNLASKKS